MLKRALWPWVLLSGTVRWGCLPVGDLCGRRVWSLRSHENIATVPLLQRQLEVSGERRVR